MSSYKETELSYIDLPSDSCLQTTWPWLLDDFALALQLGIRCKTLWFCITTKDKQYKRFTIPKRTGGRRPIHAPEPVIKWIQQQIHERILKPFPILDCVGAYVEGKRCADSAQVHVGAGVRIGMDLKDFFPSHGRARIRNFFKRHYGYNHQVASLLADLCTVREGAHHYAPQGSPASPMLCNMMAQETLDREIMRVLGPHGWAYTRYSDDLSLSHKDDLPSKEVNQAIKQVTKISKESGYRINLKKTKVQRRWRRQQMLGIVTNEKLNISRPLYRQYRAILHNCLHQGVEVNALRFGWDPPESFISHLEGKISYFASISETRGGKLKTMLHEVKRALEEENAQTHP